MNRIKISPIGGWNTTTLKYWLAKSIQMLTCIMVMSVLAASLTFGQCQNHYLDDSQVALSIEVHPDPETDGNEGIVSIILNGDAPGEEFQGLLGGEVLLSFPQNLDAIAHSQFEFEDCWLDQPDDHLQVIEQVGPNQLLLYLERTNCLTSSGAGVLAKVRLIPHEPGFEWQGIQMIDGGILIEDIFPAKTAPKTAPKTEPTPNQEIELARMASHHFQVTAKNQGKVMAKVYDLGGNQIRQATGENGTLDIHLDGCRPGVYLLIVTTSNGNTVRKKILIW